MNGNEDLYCHLYVDADLEESELANKIAEVLQTKADGLFVDSANGDLAVRANQEFDENARQNQADGFLFYRYHIDVEPNSSLGEKNAVELVSRLLENFWANGYLATAACGYEDKLPNNNSCAA